MSLVELRVRDLAVFADAVVPVGPGFTALTGETGSGKSVCVAALRLALGGRVDGDPVRAGAGAARVSAVFDEAPPVLRDRLAALGIPADDLLTLTREAPRDGRGSSRINGALVSAAVLREAGETLAEITLQGASHRLLQRARQRDLLDLAAGAGPLRDEVRDAVAAWRAAEATVGETRRRLAASAAELAEARRVVDELEALNLRPGEEENLAAERLRLRNAAALGEAAEALHRAAAGDDEATGAADLLAAAADGAASLRAIDPGLEALATEAAELVERLRDLGLSARRHAGTIAADPARLAAVEERLDALARVVRRHGSVDEALDALGVASDLLGAAEDGGDRVAAAEAAADAARARATALASQLSALRRGAAPRLERDVAAALHLLELPHARFRVDLELVPDPAGIEVGGARVRCGAAGADEVAMRLATNRGVEPRALEDGPSGGELARLVLALAACVTETGSPLLVLDEVDTGIGGETAARVGDLLAAIGRGRQVIAVTHRAEIASRATDHLVVRKRDTAAGAVASVEPATGDARLEEIARLMSGRVTAAALARAVELRGEAVATINRPGPPRARRTRTMPGDGREPVRHADRTPRRG